MVKLNSKRKWHIFEQRGDAVTHVREGSVRFGRTLRAANKHKRTTNARVFVAKRDGDGRPDLADLRWTATTEHPDLIQQRRNRLKLMEARANAKAAPTRW